MNKVWDKRFYKCRGWAYYVYSLLCLRYTKFNFKWLQDHARLAGIDRLHIGCGHVIIDGWLNILYDKRQEYGHFKRVGKAWVLNYDLLGPWPVSENSISFVAGSHMIEHLDLNQGLLLARYAYSVLKDGGIVRLSCPDLEIYVNSYVKKDKGFFNNPLIREWCAFKAAETPGEIFIAKAYDSGGAHKWFYDFESLKDVLERAGFVGVRKVKRLEGSTPDLACLEPAQRELETLYIEAVKRL